MSVTSSSSPLSRPSLPLVRETSSGGRNTEGVRPGLSCRLGTLAIVNTPPPPHCGSPSSYQT
eukprot:111353-Hanusia_phi.AAC.1